MNLHKIADITVDLGYKYNRLKKQAEAYKINEDSKPDMTIYLSDAFLEQKHKENPHLSVEDCEYIFTSSVFYTGMLQYGGFMLHSSAVIMDGRAYLFSAPSGTGKSTHTGLWKKYYPETVIINDDMPAIRKVDGIYRAFGTPWAGKTHINENVSAPLHAMVFIERDEKCSITEIEPMEAIVRMMREIPISVYKGQSDLLLDFYNDLFKTVPSYLLKCNISKDAVEIVKDKLML